MCGVAAIFAYGPAAPPVDERELVAIRDRMRARGPDAAGLWIDLKRRMALGHRRLSTPVGLWIADEFGIPTGGRFSRRWAREVSSFWLGKTRTTACATTASVAGGAH